MEEVEAMLRYPMTLLRSLGGERGEELASFALLLALVVLLALAAWAAQGHTMERWLDALRTLCPS